PSVKIGVELDKSNTKEWTLIFARNGDDPCTFFMGTFNFKCGKDGITDQIVHGVKMSRKQTGSGLSDLEFEMYTYFTDSRSREVAEAFKDNSNKKGSIFLKDSKMNVKSEGIVFFQ
ncbi:hypothetical protein PMAYCL1PPCAC_13603, partial [Pristionchus mayeri]